MGTDMSWRAELPKAPKRRLTAWDITMLIGVPMTAYIGGIGAGIGNAGGLLLSGFAALGVVGFYASRLGRRNEPRIAPY
ncbi:hypothetical protein MF406_12260 [Georgenia sp. TF02-10]|uniref:hypothetical protein n=1 Tax=Georgenia sp. TF02-10 TaxID=2917725 RepID=UPI001FA73E18|nr:hypothetical protein [Georgenia sp. TF02-10]UNX53754.1 hypothetical protein MF406_12260 [Georgenia sp. TF02-10]